MSTQTYVEIDLPAELSGFTVSLICARLRTAGALCHVHLAGDLDGGRMLDGAPHQLYVDEEHQDLAVSMVRTTMGDSAGAPRRRVSKTMRLLVTAGLSILIVVPLIVSGVQKLASLFS